MRFRKTEYAKEHAQLADCPEDGTSGEGQLEADMLCGLNLGRFELGEEVLEEADRAAGGDVALLALGPRLAVRNAKPRPLFRIGEVEVLV